MSLVCYGFRPRYRPSTRTRTAVGVMACLICSASPAPAPLHAQTPNTASAASAGAAPRLGKYRFVITGQNLKDPVAVAIGPDDRIYVADTGNHRVRVFDSTGKPVQTVGAAGEDAAGLLAPQGVAVDQDGTVFVSDTGHHRIQVFKPDGAFVRNWGGYGSSPGRFLHPRGIAVGKERVCIADTGNHRIQVFDRRGSLLLAFGRYGHEDGRLVRPSDVAVDAEGNLYVVDEDRNRIQKFDRQGKFLRAWGTWGFPSGMLSAPSGLDFRAGALFVADTRNHRVQVFDKQGESLYQWGLHAILPREGQGRLHYPDDVAVAPSGRLAVICESFEDRCQVFSTVEPGGKEDQIAALFSGLSSASHYGRRCDAFADLLLIPEPDSHLISVFNTTRPVPVLIHQFGTHGTGPGKFIEPTDVKIDAQNGRVYVLDRGSRRLQVFRLNRKPGDEVKFIPTLSRFVKSVDLAAIGRAVPALNESGVFDPGVIEQDAGGNIYLLDSTHARVVVFDRKLKFLRAWGDYGAGPGQMRGPTDLAMSRSGEIVYVVDSLNRRVQAFDPQGGFLFFFAWNGSGGDTGGFIRPFGVMAGKDGYVYVTDAGTHQVLKFDEQGRFVKRWGSQGVGAGAFHKPAGIVQDDQLRLIVIDFGNHRGQIFSPDGAFINVFGARAYTEQAREVVKRRRKKQP